ncbi:alanine aminotransferase 2-like [Denticeps clupeoides]|uniref:alanine aminotransferase 2-like n=1 Tax=Denticeps clupeoides TaxID=299321 RepID=UPI0010A45F77|nr:alanine aminotransferase 2-like [Denticeps clupeoides]
MSVLRAISPDLSRIRLVDQDCLSKRAAQIREALLQGLERPFKHLIDISLGDAHRGGLQPITFVRQVISACLYPSLLDSGRLPIDVKSRARNLLKQCEGESVGSYTATCGLPKIQHSLSEFISRRDRGVPSSPENIFITSGSQQALMLVLRLFVHGKGSLQTGIMTPVPSSPLFNMALSSLGGAMVPYHLCEEEGWTLRLDEMRRALATARRHCNPMGLYVINPGNPVGQVQSQKSIEDVIRFAAEEKLFLLADEVYQDSVHDPTAEFVSYKRVLHEMGPPYSNTVELASFNSASKGFMGECGLRGGYVEFVNLDSAVMGHVYTLFSTEACTAVMGQIALDIMANPPRSGDASYTAFFEEVQNRRNTLNNNAKRVQETLNSLDGMSCQPIRGGIYAFPQLHLPARAVAKAEEAGVAPDLLYCMLLLEEMGLCVGPGSEHLQRKDTHHLRLCIATPEDTLQEVLERLSTFHLHFMRLFSG